VGWGKSIVLGHKKRQYQISETRKGRGKVTMEGLYKNSPTLFRTLPSRTPCGLLFPKIGVRNPHPKTKSPIAITSGTGENTNFKSGQNIHTVYPNKSPLKILEKMERGRIQRLSVFWIPPIISAGTGEATDFKCGRYIHKIHSNKSSLKILEKREHGRIQGLPKFWGTTN